MLQLVQRTSLHPDGFGGTKWVSEVLYTFGYFPDMESIRPVIDRLNASTRAEFGLPAERTGDEHPPVPIFSRRPIASGVAIEAARSGAHVTT